MEGNVWEGCPVSIKKMKSEKAYRESQLAVIVVKICALFNSYGGGKFSIKYEDESILPEEIDDVLRMIEQRLVNIIGACTFYTKVMIQRNEANKLDIFVTPTKSLCTVDYKLYLPTQTQVIPILPWEPFQMVKAILDREVSYQQLNPPVEIEDFVVNRQVSFTEADCIQFKQLKAANSKCVSFADRMTNKSNKLERYFSAFANKNGGRLYYGITNGGVVKGEIIEEKDREEIIRKVTKTISTMKWCGGKLEKGKRWDIQFVPVKDENMDREIPCLFVVIISIAALRGGLFIQEPESYRVVDGKIERMPFLVWMHKLFDGMVPSFVHGQWSSKEKQRIWRQVLQELMTYQNDGKYPAFMKYAEIARQSYPDLIEVQLIILEQTSAQAHKRGELKKAVRKFKEFKDMLQREDDPVVFRLRAMYAKSAIARAEGDYEESYKIAQEGFELAEMAPAGILTAWFYNHVGMVETILSKQTKESGERARLEKSALENYTKALEHTKASSIEQEFPTIIADLQQRIHTCRAITTLGDFAGGANFKQATPSDIKAAKTDLTNYQLLVKEHSVTSYRKIYYHLAKADRRLCKWWQQRQQQTRDVRSLQNSGISKYLKKAFVCATKAKDLAMKFHFQEMNNYASNRLAKITEIMIKLNLSSIRLPKNNNNSQ